MQPQEQAPATPDPRLKDSTQPIGTNFENLSEALQNQLWALFMEQERQDEIPRRNEICEILRRKLYYRDEQYWWYSESQYQWFPPNVPPQGMEDNYQAPAFQHVTNIIKATAEGLQSVLSQSNTAATFWPESPSNPNDVETAKNATKAIDLIHRRNNWQNLIDEATYYMCTDGFLGGYVRHVTDAERYGSEEMDVLGISEVQVAPPTAECPGCDFQAEGTTEQTPICPTCGEPLHDVPGVSAMVPQHMGTVSIPKGQEVITIVPALNLKRTMWADDQIDFLYLEWIYDMHKARAMSLFPHVAQKIWDSAGSYGDSGTANSYERIARRLLYLGTGWHTGMVLQDLGVIRRGWLRPCVFETVRDTAMKAQLKSLYTKGACVTFYNDVYCESRNECMDEKWETMQTCNGEGQVRPTLISSLIPIQDQINDSGNLIFEQGMNGVPEAFGDQNVIDFEARSEQTAAVGNMTPVDMPPGADIRQKVMFSPAVEPSVALQKWFTDLMGPISQFISGYFPALFGGDTGSNDTAAGIAAQRNQALGRIGRAWRRLQTFCANLDGKAINCFQENMSDDVELPKKNDSGEYESDWIRVSDMKGSVIAFPEVDAQYPTLQSDLSSMFMGLINEGNPWFLALTQDEENAEYVLREVGATEIVVPGQDQRRKTMKDIASMTAQGEGPQMVTPPPQPEMPGQPPQPPPQPQMIPSVQPDPLVDDLAVALKTCKKWLISDAGQEMKQTNPPGYMNVYSYAKACDQLIKQAAFQQATVAQAMQGQGPANDLSGAEQHIQAPPAHDPNAAKSSEAGPSDSQT